MKPTVASVAGHWVMQQTAPAPFARARAAMANLNANERAAYQHIMQEFKSQGRSPTADRVAQLDWAEVPIPIEEWLDSEAHIGDTAKSTWPVYKQHIANIFNGGYHEIILSGSVGAGKDWVAVVCLMRLLYELCCLKDPTRTLGMGAGEQIYIVPISRTVQLAKRVVFGGLAQKLNLSPWFKGKFKETLDYVSFPGKNIVIIGGSSTDASVLGLGVYAFLEDEGNFYGVQRQKDKNVSAGGAAPDKAQAIYDGMIRRVNSRFRSTNLKGMGFLLSSKRSTSDFTERRIKEVIASEDSSGLYVIDTNTWLARPDRFANQKFLRMVIDSSSGRCRPLKDHEEAPPNCLVYTYPEVYQAEAARDPIGFTRDMAGIATDAYAPFISEREAVDKMFNKELPLPFDTEEWCPEQQLKINWTQIRTEDERGDQVPACCPRAPRHVHLDLSKNKCATGFCMGHQGGNREVERVDLSTGKKIIEEVPVFHIDAILRIVAPKGGDIDHGEVRGLIYRFMEGGFYVRTVSMDQWMIVPNEQELARRGLKIEMISTVRKLDPYLAGRNAIYERRVNAHLHEHLRHELLSLELTDDKVVHTATSTKDVADALVGVLYYLSRHATGGGGDNVAITRAPAAPNKQAPVRMMPGGDFKWADEEEEEEADKDSTGGFGSFIIGGR